MIGSDSSSPVLYEDRLTSALCGPEFKVFVVSTNKTSTGCKDIWYVCHDIIVALKIEVDSYFLYISDGSAATPINSCKT